MAGERGEIRLSDLSSDADKSSDQAAAGALDKFHANKKITHTHTQTRAKTMKSGLNLEPPASERAHTDAWNAQTERPGSLRALNILSLSLSFAPNRQLYSNKSDRGSDNC